METPTPSGTVTPAAGATAPPAAPTTAAATAPATGTDAPKPAEAGKETPSNAAPSGADAGKKDPKAAGAVEGASNGAKPGAEGTLLTGEPPKAPPADIALKLPEGVLSDKAQLDEFKAIAQRHGLKSEGAQEFVDFSVRLQKAGEKAARENYEKTVEGWKQAAATDKEFGGHSFKENLSIAQKALKKCGDGMAKALAESGLGNHPEVIRGLFRLGKTMSEDSVSGTVTEDGGTKTSPQKQTWESLYEGKMGPPSADYLNPTSLRKP